MEFNEINVPEGIIQQIEPAGPFAGITVDAGNPGIFHPNVNPGVSYEDTLGEINLERARYLQNTDEMLEEWHSCTLI
ncbi:MAG: hypothetical protein Q8M95_11370 [Candidatus Methanoperedens sp.]|nr:hypothetical protein [Candidatus Methanoperedens sp.]